MMCRIGLDLYARRSIPGLLVPGLLILLIITEVCHCFQINSECKLRRIFKNARVF